MQNEFDSPDEWDEEEPYDDGDDPDWRADGGEAGTTTQGGTPVAPAGGAALVAAHCHC